MSIAASANTVGQVPEKVEKARSTSDSGRRTAESEGRKSKESESRKSKEAEARKSKEAESRKSKEAESRKSKDSEPRKSQEKPGRRSREEKITKDPTECERWLITIKADAASIAQREFESRSMLVCCSYSLLLVIC